MDARASGRDPIRGEKVGIKTQKNPPPGVNREGNFFGHIF
nr:MAG TPA: hypothetical protein [Caudoviricetes sp.]